MYGSPLVGASAVAVPDDLAGLFAAAHLRITGRPAAANRDGGQLVVHEPGPQPVGRDVDEVVAALRGSDRPVVLAGPGVVAERAAEGLRALAAAGSLGVLNTWGAKGLFDWQSPHHLATAGLQLHDFELAGLAEADLIVATGLDECESGERWRLAPAVQVGPRQLVEVARRWSRAARPIQPPRLRTELARVTQDGWSTERAPLAPSRVTRQMREVLGPDGFVAAAPGTCGFWVARTFPTTRLGSAVVPAATAPAGFAAACAVVARLLCPQRPVLLAIDGRAGADGAAQLDPSTAAVVEAGRRLGIRLPVEVWCEGGLALDAEAHASRLAQLLHRGGTVSLATDPAQLERFVEVAGPVVAWGGLPLPEVEALSPSQEGR